jgi:hypothetical protein
MVWEGEGRRINHDLLDLKQGEDRSEVERQNEEFIMVVSVTKGGGKEWKKSWGGQS